jgi:hypothetical protein
VSLAEELAQRAVSAALADEDFNVTRDEYRLLRQLTDQPQVWDGLVFALMPPEKWGTQVRVVVQKERVHGC